MCTRLKQTSDLFYRSVPRFAFLNGENNLRDEIILWYSKEVNSNFSVYSCVSLLYLFEDIMLHIWSWKTLTWLKFQFKKLLCILIMLIEQNSAILKLPWKYFNLIKRLTRHDVPQHFNNLARPSYKKQNTARLWV